MYPKVFYSVFGINGFGVYTDYEKVLKAKQYRIFCLSKSCSD